MKQLACGALALNTGIVQGNPAEAGNVYMLSVFQTVFVFQSKFPPPPPAPVGLFIRTRCQRRSHTHSPRGIQKEESSRSPPL